MLLRMIQHFSTSSAPSSTTTTSIHSCPFFAKSDLDYVYEVPSCIILICNIFFLIWIILVGGPLRFAKLNSFINCNFNLYSIFVFSDHPPTISRLDTSELLQDHFRTTYTYLPIYLPAYPPTHLPTYLPPY